MHDEQKTFFPIISAEQLPLSDFSTHVSIPIVLGLEHKTKGATADQQGLFIDDTIKKEVVRSQLSDLLNEQNLFKSEQNAKILDALFHPKIEIPFSVQSLGNMQAIVACAVFDKSTVREFLRAVVISCAEPSLKPEINCPARSLIGKSQDADLYDLSNVVQLLVRHSSSLDRHDLEKLFAGVRKFIATSPYRIGIDISKDYRQTEGCEINIFSLAGLSSESANIAQALIDKFDSPKAAQKIFPPISLSSLSSLTAEEWKAKIHEIRERGESSYNDIKSHYSSNQCNIKRATELMLRMYEISGAEIKVSETKNASFSAKWQVCF